MPETLDTLGAKIDALATRIEDVKTELSGRIDDVKTTLLICIEGVDGKVDLALEKIDHLIERDAASTAAHERFEQRLDHHELRLTALEKRQPPRSKSR